MLNNLKNRKLSYAGHIIRKTSGHYDTLVTTIEGRQTRKRETKTNMGRRYKRMDWLKMLRSDKESCRKSKLTWGICNPQQWTQHRMKLCIVIFKAAILGVLQICNFYHKSRQAYVMFSIYAAFKSRNCWLLL